MHVCCVCARLCVVCMPVCVLFVCSFVCCVCARLCVVCVCVLTHAVILFAGPEKPEPDLKKELKKKE